MVRRNTYTAGAAFGASALNAQKHANATEGVAKDVSVSPGSGSFEVDVGGPIDYVIGDELSSVSSTSVTHDSPDSNDRVDLITINSSGTVAIVKGDHTKTTTSNGTSQPVDPDIPTDEVLLAAVYIRSGASEILAGDIYEGYQTTVNNAHVVQSTEPPQYDGWTWTDPSTGIHYSGYNGEWHPIPPVQVTDETNTFQESGVTVTQTNTSISSGSVTLTESLYDITNFTFEQSQSIGGETQSTGGLEFHDTGAESKLYVGGKTNDNIYEYTLSSRFDVSSESLTNTADVSTNAGSPEGIHWADSGSKFYIVIGDGTIKEFSASTPYDTSTLSFDNSADVSSQDSVMNGVTWHNDGSKLFLLGDSNDNIYEYSASTAYDTTTLSFTDSFSVGGQGNFFQDLTRNSDGTKFYITENDGDDIHSYSLTTAFDISTASSSNSFDYSGQDSTMTGIAWSDQGGYFYALGNGSNDVYEYHTGETSGNVLVEWSAPTDLKSWDLATFQSTENGETVTVDVEQDDGTVEFSDISQNFDISTVADSVNVQLRANLSRVEIGNDPSIDYLARRYVR